MLNLCGVFDQLCFGLQKITLLYVSHHFNSHKHRKLSQNLKVFSISLEENYVFEFFFVCFMYCQKQKLKTFFDYNSLHLYGFSLRDISDFFMLHNLHFKNWKATFETDWYKLYSQCYRFLNIVSKHVRIVCFIFFYLPQRRRW